ncbi:T9SS type A sorting domain-containing protein [Flavobacterium covae]|uniref:T9SS type A sorting domain-containing protein n=1 Tax=Flavobacterium covae TaxID=2906076 RepID=UPI0033922BAA
MKRKLFLALLLVLSKSAFSQSASIDATFAIGNGFNISSAVSTIALQSDNKILVSGVNFSSFNGTSISSNIIRVNSNGSFDTAFPNGYISTAYSFAQQTDGKIVIAGSSGSNFYRIKRFNIDGTIDNTFSVGLNPSDGFNNTIYKIALQSDGKFIVQGQFTAYGTTTIKQLARLNSSGSLDTSFNTNINAITAITQTNGVRSFTLLASGKILVATNSTPRLIRLNSDGSLDNTFSSSITNSVDMMTEQTDNKILVATTFSTNSGELVRINSTGTNDGTFTNYSITGGRINDVHQLSTNKILISNYNGATATNRLVRINNNGGVDTSFNIGTGLNNDISKIIIQPDGKILIGGFFASYNGTTKRAILRLIGDSNLSIVNNEINKIAIYPNPVKETIYLSNITETEYEIFDILSKSISKGKTNVNQISVNSLSKGIYILKIKIGENIINQKFIKE